MRGGVVVTYRLRHAEPQVRFLARASNYERGENVKCVKCCVSFVLALVLSSVSLVPCFANTAMNTTGADCSILVYQKGYFNRDIELVVPIVGTTYVSTEATGVAEMPLCPYIETQSPFLFTADKTAYWCIYPFVGTNLDSNWVADILANMTADNVPVMFVGAGNAANASVATQVDVKFVYYGYMNNQKTYAPVYRATIPCGNGEDPSSDSWIPNGNFYIKYPDTTDTVLWTVGSSGTGQSISFCVEMFQFVDTTDSAILDVLDQILLEAQEANVNLSNILTACNNIITELKALSADTDTIITLLNTLVGLSQSQLTQLQNISSSVDAIYYFLTQELKSESEELSGEAAEIGSGIDNNHAAEEYYQTSMQGSYDSLDLENFSFGGIAGALELVGTVFSDMWAAWGEYTILFTYPLILGIALLVIGRLSKQGGGNSSRNSEHKGGEGGA